IPANNTSTGESPVVPKSTPNVIQAGVPLHVADRDGSQTGHALADRTDTPVGAESGVRKPDAAVGQASTSSGASEAASRTGVSSGAGDTANRTGVAPGPNVTAAQAAATSPALKSGPQTGDAVSPAPEDTPVRLAAS